MAGHTKWTARKGGYGDGWTIYGHDDHGEYLVAENIGPYADDDEAEAEAAREAHLIAAAPDLLEALKRAVAEDLGDNWKAAANAAIAKAEQSA